MTSKLADDIKGFIEERLRELERKIVSSQMNINGVDINQTIRRDIKAARDLVGIASALETAGGAAGTAKAAEHILAVIARRWSDHPAFDKSWPN
jgi:hypothetical protein